MAEEKKDQAQTVTTTSTAGVSRQNTSAELQGTSNKEKLRYNCVYEGIVVYANVASRLITVTVDGVLLEGCQMMSTAVGSYIGVKDVMLPAPGARVLVVYCIAGTYVIAGQPATKTKNTTWAPPVTGNIDYDVLDKSAAFRQTQSFSPSTPITVGAKLPIDMFPGEWEKTTEIGPALRLLYNFAQMDSGSLAKIEVHLLNDMVRIINNYFAHHHVGGDELIWNKKYSTWESHFTPYPHEAEGKLYVQEPLIEKTGKAYDPKKSCDPDTVSATGRWRKSTYIGFLGDMIHTWITHPTAVVSSYMENADRATNFRQWIGSDGTFMVQAAGGIHMEAGSNIICPTVLKSHNDLELKLEEQMENLDASYLKIWGQGPNWRDLRTACWQMRAYLRYIPQWHSLARWRQLEDAGYCKIPDPADAPIADPSAGEADRESITGTDPYFGYSAINLSPMGTITITDGVRNSIIMDGVSIQISTSGNLELKAGGTLSLSGRDVVIQAADNMEICSFFGGLVMKARTTLKALVEKGRLWFKTDMDPEDDDDPDYPLEDGEAPEVEKQKYGIILDAPRSSILNYGSKGFVAATSDEEAHINFEAAGKDTDVNIIADHDINMYASRYLKLRAVGFAVKAAFVKFASFIVKIGERFLLRGGRLAVTMLEANFVQAATHVSKAKHVSQNEDLEEPDFEEENTDDLGEEVDDMMKIDLQSEYKQEELKDLRFEMHAWDEASDTYALSWKSYKASAWEDSVETSSSVREEASILYPVSTRLLGNIRTNTSNYPWPGQEGKRLTCPSGPTEILTKPDNFMESDLLTTDDFTPGQFTRVYRKK